MPMPGIDGYRAALQDGIARQQADVQQATGTMGILAKLQEMQQAQQLRGILASDLPDDQKKQALMRTPGGIQILGQLATQANAGITGQLHAAQLGEIQRNATVKAGEQQAKGALASLLSPMGSFGASNIGNPDAAQPSPNAQVFNNDADAIRAMQEAEAKGVPFTGNVPNPANVRALTVAAGNAIPRGTANALLGAGGNGQTIAPRVVQDASSPTGWSYLNVRDMSRTPGAPVPFSATRGATNPNGAAPPITGDFSVNGQAFLDSIPESDRTFIKKIANYEIDPKTLETRGGQRSNALKMAAQFDPTFDQKNYNTIYNAVNRFATGTQGNTVRSINVAIEHMDTARQLGAALKNGDIPMFNQLANQFATETGQAAPTNFNAVKEIVADEVVKGVIGSAGAQQDRESLAKKIRDASSPEQLNGVFDQWTALMGGQLKGLERQYQGATMRKDFKERYLTDRALAALGGQPVPTNAVTAPTASPTPQVQRATSKSGKPMHMENGQWVYD